MWTRTRTLRRATKRLLTMRPRRRRQRSSRAQFRFRVHYRGKPFAAYDIAHIGSYCWLNNRKFHPEIMNLIWINWTTSFCFLNTDLTDLYTKNASVFDTFSDMLKVTLGPESSTRTPSPETASSQSWACRSPSLGPSLSSHSRRRPGSRLRPPARCRRSACCPRCSQWPGRL